MKLKFKMKRDNGMKLKFKMKSGKEIVHDIPEDQAKIWLKHGWCRRICCTKCSIWRTCKGDTKYCSSLSVTKLNDTIINDSQINPHMKPRCEHCGQLLKEGI